MHRVAGQLGYGVESVRLWVRQADVDEGHVPGVSTSDAAKMKALEQENRELKLGQDRVVLTQPPGLWLEQLDLGKAEARRARPFTH